MRVKDFLSAKRHFAGEVVESERTQLVLGSKRRVVGSAPEQIVSTLGDRRCWRLLTYECFFISFLEKTSSYTCDREQFL